MNEFSVTPLGTVSPYPKGKCNCAGFLVRNGEKKILLDCGSGVSRLLHFPDDLDNLMIVISHLHIDHYADLGSFQYASYVYKNLGMLFNKVKVYYPYLHKVNDKIMESYENDSFLDISSYSTVSEINFGDMKLSFFRNLHDIITYSVKIVCNDKVVVYTADTGLNDKLIDFCRGADLLISEATFLRGQNKTKWHMYAYEAGVLASKAKVKKLVLTHFWPEINKSKYVEEAKEYFFNVVAAKEGKKLVLRK